MAFDHGAPTVKPVNFAIIVALSIIWWPIAPWWVILPLAIMMAYLTLDQYNGMAMSHIILVCALIISIPLTSKLRDFAIITQTETHRKLLITGLFTFLGLVSAIFGLIVSFGWLYDRKYSLRLGKKVKISWGSRKGEFGKVEQLDPDCLVATIRLKISGEIVRYPSNVFFEEPHWWKGREKELPPGTKMKVHYGKYDNYVGTVLEYDAGAHVVCVKLDDLDNRLWFASNLVDVEAEKSKIACG